MRHSNISVFVPHIGCPNRCSFCNQNTITGQVKVPNANDVEAAVKEVISHPNYDAKNTQLAFFGGSFTKIDKALMEELLSVGYEFVKNKTISGIRISTRPDGIDEDILNTLKAYGVTAIELGCQSMNDKVLGLNRRGHKAEDVKKAAALIKAKGFELGLQMMTGLYGDSDEGAINTAKEIIALSPKTVRIYPTLVLKGTYLAELYERGEYSPQSLEEGVELTSNLLLMFEKAKINVIRVGLHTVESDGFVAGPWHPAFGEMCQSRIYRKKVLEIIEKEKTPKGKLKIFVPFGCVSKMIGVKKSNIEFLASMGYNCKVYEHNKMTLSVMVD
ncbi:MAG: radical SAM protein [Clostridia bacterium]|nr:radical SAM protein [Clostridia bacterium]